MTEVRAISIPEFASLYGLNIKTVQVGVTRAPENFPKVTRIGRSIRFTMKAIEAWEVAMTAE
jgi:predicted DNA-binding transcriptional regulator AlpA